MDFTYFLAAAFAMIVGAAVIFLIKGGVRKWRLIGIAFLIALVLNLAVLVNWTAIGGDISIAFAVLDVGLIAAYSFIGCLIAILPLLAARNAWRKMRRRDSTP